MNHTTTEKSAPTKSKTLRSRGTMGNALSASLDAETNSFQARLQKAESVLGNPAEVEKPLVEKQKKSSNPQIKVPQGVTVVEAARVIRDAFTMPEADYALIGQVQQRCLESAVRVTKSEALRAGLQALSMMSDEQLVKAFTRLEKVRVGRPKVFSHPDTSKISE